jgi:hypothetical protein
MSTFTSPRPGYGLVGLGFLHTAALAIGGASAIRQMFARGVWNAGHGDPMRLTPFWSFQFGALLIVVGWILVRTARAQHPVSRPLAATLLALFTFGAVVVPAGGFWLGILLALWLLVRARDVHGAVTDFRALDLRVHRELAGVPLHDVSVVDLPGGGPGRTVADLRAILSAQALTRADPAVRFLFAVRGFLGRVFGWDGPEGATPAAFRPLYQLEHESLAELENATVHTYLASVLVPTASGYRLYWAVYVRPVSRLTPVYMALIAPFRRFIVYPAIFRRLRKAWIEAAWPLGVVESSR